jgi:hypothetical protein
VEKENEDAELQDGAGCQVGEINSRAANVIELIEDASLPRKRVWTNLSKTTLYSISAESLVLYRTPTLLPGRNGLVAGERLTNRRPKSYFPFHHKSRQNVIHSPEAFLFHAPWSH